MSNNQRPTRSIQIQPQQATQLVQALKNEVTLARAAGNDTAKAQQHYAKAESIKQVLLNYQAQQKARAAQKQGPQGAVATPQPTVSTPSGSAGQNLGSAAPGVAGMGPAAHQIPASTGQLRQSPGSSSSPTPALPANALTVENFNQVKTRLEEFERKIAQLQNSKKTYNMTPEQINNVESQLTDLKTKYTKYQKFAYYMKNQLLEQARNGKGPESQPVPDAKTGRSASPPVSASAATNAAATANAAAAAASTSSTAAASSPKPVGVPGVNLSGITKPSVPSIPISSTLNIKPPAAITMKPNSANNRPTLSGGVANGMGQILGTPAIMRLPTYDIATTGGATTMPDNGGRVLTKRKLIELVNTIGADEGDGKTVIDGDVEELLLDLADEFISSVTGFACRLAKHRKAEAIDVKDVQLHLERNWNIRIPGYATDEIKSIRKWQPSSSYQQKVSGVDISKSVNGDIN